MSRPAAAPLKEVPMHIQSDNGDKSYSRGRYLGKGGFARCYELTDKKSKAVVAGKVVSKTLLQKKYNKDKMVQEIQIHRGLSHEHIVKLIDYFEDDDNVYVIMELCTRSSMMELHQRRRGITEPEARYFTYQIAKAVEYIHGQKIIHRDLKLGNIFINSEMSLKLGDFGLAAIMDDDVRRTLCGTPNYIAPEVLNKVGHSYEVDIWAIGCILYTLLVGKPPFETKKLEETYQRIKTNKFTVPCWVSAGARSLITALLSHEPKLRPATKAVRQHAFFSGFRPARLPVSALTMAPKFTAEQAPPGYRCKCCTAPAGGFASPAPQRPLQPVNGLRAQAAVANKSRATSSDCHLSDLRLQLTNLMRSTTTERNMVAEDICETPEAMPVFWISKWVDYSDKYGMAYELCDKSLGVLFNDCTKLILDAAGNQLSYVDREHAEAYYTMGNTPDTLDKKVKIFTHYRSYMQTLVTAGAGAAPKAGDDLARLPCLRHWFRTKNAIVFHLSNGTVQINFTSDHIKLILCPLLGAVSIIDAGQALRVLNFDLIGQHGCTQDVYNRLRYANSMCERLAKHYSEVK